MADLVRFPVLLPGATTNCRPRSEHLLREAAVWEQLQIVLECSFPGSLLEYVDSGLGIALTPLAPALLKQGASSPLPGWSKRVRDLSALLGKEPLFYVRRKGWVETPIAAAFRKSILRS